MREHASAHLQESAIPSENLIKRVSGEYEKSRTREHDWVVWEGRVGNDKVLLRRLQRLHEAVVRVIKDPCRIARILSNQRCRVAHALRQHL